MADFGMQLLDVGKVLAALTQVSAKVDIADQELVTRVGHMVERAAKGNFEGSHGRGQPHVGGNKPNVVSGTARRSIYPDPVTHSADGYKTQVGPRVVYGRALEFGNPRNGSRPFPYFTPAVDTVREKVPAIAAAIYGAATRV